MVDASWRISVPNSNLSTPDKMTKIGHFVKIEFFPPLSLCINKYYIVLVENFCLFRATNTYMKQDLNLQLPLAKTNKSWSRPFFINTKINMTMLCSRDAHDQIIISRLQILFCTYPWGNCIRTPGLGVEVKILVPNFTANCISFLSIHDLLSKHVQIPSIL